MSNEDKSKKNVATLDVPSHSLKVMASFSVASLGLGIITSAIGMQLLYFYEVLLQMPAALFIIGNGIYVIWDAIDDPLLGYMSDRPKRFWGKWGKRYPWVMVSFAPVCITFALLYGPPFSDEMLLLAWLIVNLFIFDTFRSLWNINFSALLYEKYITDDERTKISGFNNIFRQLGGVFAMIVPGFLINYMDPSTFLNYGIFVSILSAICVIIAIPGMKEDKWMKERAVLLAQSGVYRGSTLVDFFSTMKRGFKTRNFSVFLIVGTLFFLMSIMQQASIPYYISCILVLGAEAQLLIYMPYLIIVIAVTPFAVKIAKKINPVKMFKYLLFTYGIGAFLLLIPTDLISAIIVQSIIAFISGFTIIVLTPVIGMMLDEATLSFKAHKEGILLGIYIFFQALAGFASTLIILLVHSLTGFDPTLGASQTALAFFGLRLQIAIIPGIIMMIAGIIFMFGWTLTDEKMVEIRAKLKELKLR